VVEASNGAVALPQYRSNPPDLIITDLLMPDKDGLETIMDIKKLNPKARIIAMSGGGHEHAEIYLRAARSFGALEILSKPFELDLLRKTIAKVLSTP
jgi:YesN/AraC family two-component response regulator